MRYISTKTDTDRRALGGKAAALAALADLDLNATIPAWFALRPDAFTDSLSADQQAALQAGRFDEALRDVRPSDAVTRELRGALRDLLGESDEAVAARSSAVEEDGAAHAFAGQLDSFLFVPREEVAEKVADVWCSAFAERVRAYRRAKGLVETPAAPAVLIQRVVDAERAGVAFSVDPASGRRSEAVISAAWGLGSALVDGGAEGDTVRVDRAGRITERQTARQTVAHRPAEGGGVERVALDPDMGARPAISDAEARQVAALVRRLEAHFGMPQDIEWAFAKGRLWLLQSRPITALDDASEPDEAEGALRLWDNSNIAESYGGVTTPLTFSFARRAYEEVYRSFCRLMGVSEQKLDAHAGTFRSMIGLVRGRIYYNLGSWYDTLALLPGFQFNRALMEEMMGVSDTVPDALRPASEAVSLSEKLRDGGRLLRATLHLMREYKRLPRRTAAFTDRLDDALDASADPSQMSLDALAVRYRSLEGRLLARWDAPIVNDFFAMIFFGLSRKLVERWGPEDAAGLHNALLGGEGGIISTEPVRRLRQMAETAAGDAALIDLLTGGTKEDIEEHMPAALAEKYEAYLDRFSDRCLDELKLESATLRDDPLVLLRAVGHLARGEAPAPESTEKERRRAAEARLQDALRRRPVRRRVLRWTLRQARRLVAGRENLRFERTRVFGTARRLFVEMGRRLATAGVLGASRDVFYLEVHEVLGFVEGTAASADLRGLAAARRAEFERYHAAPAPPDRFFTRGAVHRHETFEAAEPASAPHGADVRAGQGCGPGTAQGRVRVVADPRGATLEDGAILVAERTDPGWIVLFAACSGLIVERGSLLSHAAIVARELGIPCVVGCPQATAWLRDGDRVALDGRTGRVERLETAEQPAASRPGAARPAA